MMNDYGDSIRSTGRRRALRALAAIYDTVAPPLEALLSVGLRLFRLEAWRRTRLCKKEIVAGYLEWLRAGKLEAAVAGGASRIAGDPRFA
jgi:hypothetical protein